jgi:hypothetical protein
VPFGQRSRARSANGAAEHNWNTTPVFLFLDSPFVGRCGQALRQTTVRTNQPDRKGSDQRYWIWIPLMARAITRRWISDVPSKIV